MECKNNMEGKTPLKVHKVHIFEMMNWENDSLPTQSFQRSFVNDFKANELLSVGDEMLGSALLSLQHIDFSEN